MELRSGGLSLMEVSGAVGPVGLENICLRFLSVKAAENVFII